MLSDVKTYMWFIIVIAVHFERRLPQTYQSSNNL